jgi:hypothetical protein
LQEFVIVVKLARHRSPVLVRVRKLANTKQMWMIALALLAAVVFYAYTIRGDIKVASPKPGCSSCPHAKHEKTD